MLVEELPQQRGDNDCIAHDQFARGLPVFDDAVEERHR